jgi:antibiotic biosynthesis monooxygenase (ABM) superfamily enzyme
MTSPSATQSPPTPQTLTTMEACMKLASGPEGEFWSAQEAIGPLVAAQPGFVAVIGGPIAASEWMYFCGKFETPAHMNAWYENPDHGPVMANARKKWFDAFYIRKWRRPAEGEALAGPLLCETSIAPPAPLSDAVRDATVDMLRAGIGAYNPPPFETARGEYEPQPFQFVGPLEEFPQLAPVRYLLITHWETEADLNAWLASPEMKAVSELSDPASPSLRGGRHDTASEVSVLIRHQPGERNGLNADGSLRSWTRQ